MTIPKKAKIAIAGLGAATVLGGTYAATLQSVPITESALTTQLIARENVVTRPNRRFSQVKKTADGNFTYWIDEYDGPKGKGYIVHLQKTDTNGAIEQKDIDMGKENRNYDWHIVNESNVASSTP